MSEETKKPRAVAEIQQEFQRLCARAGFLEYQVYIHQSDLDTVNQTLKELNFEAAASARAAEEEAAKNPAKEEG